MGLTPADLHRMCDRYHEYESGAAKSASIEELVKALRQAADRIEELEEKVESLRSDLLRAIWD